MAIHEGQVPGNRATREAWRAVGSIAAGTFLLVTTEFLPIGLLSRLAGDLQVSEGIAGLSVTAPGLIAAVAAPALALLAGKLDRRVVMISLTFAIILSNGVAATATGFPMFLLGRVILGLAVGGLWTFAVAVGRRLVPESAGARATVIISMGISAGTVFGMPVGAALGDWIGWRGVFCLNATFGVLVVLAQLRFLPRLPATAAIRATQLLEFARIPMARTGLIASGFVAGGHFVAYTFLEPYLRDALNLGQSGVALARAGYAVAGIVGSFLGEHLAARDIRKAFVTASLLLAVSVFAAVAMVATPAGALAMVLVWGVAFGAVPVCVQIWMFTASPERYEMGSALMVSAFQIALAAGAATGGVLVDHAGIAITYIVSAFLVFSGAATVLFSRLRNQGVPIGKLGHLVDVARRSKGVADESVSR
ncbi:MULTISPECIES: MFS transporter [Cupriavidus]